VITITETAEKYILETLDRYDKQPKLVGIGLYKNKEKQDQVEFIHHFVGHQNHIAGRSLTVGICIFPHALTEFDGTVIDYSSKKGFFTRRTSSRKL
jgi:hypothetical protein